MRESFFVIFVVLITLSSLFWVIGISVYEQHAKYECATKGYTNGAYVSPFFKYACKPNLGEAK